MEPRLINSYAVVAYIRSEAADFIDSVRCELTPGCPHHAHITVLRPRPLRITTEEAAERCRRILPRFDPFDTRLGEVSTFESSKVIKISLESGLPEFHTLHDILNDGPLAHADEYEFVPHVTVCHEAEGDCFDALVETAKERWDAYEGSRIVRVEQLTLVQQREDGVWTDLAELPLGALQPVRVRAL